MELKLKIGYKELLQLIKQLPANQLAMLLSELKEEKVEINSKKKDLPLQELLLKGPVMSKTQYEEFLSNRAYFNSWRKN